MCAARGVLIYDDTSVDWHFVFMSASIWVNTFRRNADLYHPTDRPRLEVHPPPLHGAVHLLRLRQRLPERRPHAIRHRPLDLAKRQHRVRVHIVHLVCSSVLLYSTSCRVPGELYVCTDFPRFFRTDRLCGAKVAVLMW